ncbi:MAG: hypothetical protein K2Q26_07980 [Bdellovibrionales bacterium]|nr:hypothetical protein [Bdellovibrionales bacterium]
MSSFDLTLDNSLNHSVMNDLMVTGATYFVSGFAMALLHSTVVAKHALGKVAASGCVFLFLINAVLFSLWRILLSFVPTDYRWPSLAVPAILAVILVATAAKWRVRN